MTKEEILNNALKLKLYSASVDNLEKLCDTMLSLYMLCYTLREYSYLLDCFFDNIKQNILNDDNHIDFCRGANKVYGCMILMEDYIENPNKIILNDIYNRCILLFNSDFPK